MLGKICSKLLKVEAQVKEKVKRNAFWIILFVCCLAAIALRIPFLTFENSDTRYHLVPWMERLRSPEGFSVFKDKFYNYYPPYLYFLFFASKLPFVSIIAVKLVSAVFDFLCTAVVFFVVRSETKNLKEAALSSCLFLLLPTLVLNGSFWGQCDVIYTTFALLSLSLTLKKRTTFALLFWGIAVSFKAQALWLGPVFLAIYLSTSIAALSFLLVPGVFLAMGLPATLAGRPFLEILSTYFDQSQTYNSMTMNAPGLYQLFVIPFSGSAVIFGLVIAGLTIAGAVLWLIQKKELDLHSANHLFPVSYIFALGVPFLLPKMHDRFFFLADVLGFICLRLIGRSFLVPVSLGWMASLCAYSVYLFGRSPFPMELAALANAVALGWVAWWIKRELGSPNTAKDVRDSENASSSTSCSDGLP